MNDSNPISDIEILMFYINGNEVWLKAIIDRDWIISNTSAEAQNIIVKPTAKIITFFHGNLLSSRFIKLTKN